MNTTTRVTPALTWEQREHLIDLVVEYGLAAGRRGPDADAAARHEAEQAAFRAILDATRDLVEGEVSS